MGPDKWPKHQGCKQPTAHLGGAKTALFDDLGIKNFRSVLHRVTNQSQRVECKAIHVPLPVSTVFVLVVSKPFSSSNRGAGEIGVQASRT